MTVGPELPGRQCLPVLRLARTRHGHGHRLLVRADGHEGRHRRTGRGLRRLGPGRRASACSPTLRRTSCSGRADCCARTASSTSSTAARTHVVLGEGAGVVLLQAAGRSRARRRHRVRAVVEGTAVNNDWPHGPDPHAQPHRPEAGDAGGAAPGRLHPRQVGHLGRRRRLG
ncbi:hypothetical protein LV779_34665 [Streptomyces thinghirensis]|nr:hypothetical protein [Streptomyces thinghirensis]